MKLNEWVSENQDTRAECWMIAFLAECHVAGMTEPSDITLGLLMQQQAPAGRDHARKLNPLLVVN